MFNVGPYQDVPGLRIVTDSLRKISRRRFLTRFRKYKMGKEGALCWERLQFLLAE